MRLLMGMPLIVCLKCLDQVLLIVEQVDWLASCPSDLGRLSSSGVELLVLHGKRVRL